MKKLILFLALPYLVLSAYTEHCMKTESSYQVRVSTICGMDEIVGEYPKDIAYDMAEALNAAHERRTNSVYWHEWESKNKASK